MSELNPKEFAELLPIYGTYKDAENFYHNPSWRNAASLGFSTAGDIATVFGVGTILKGAQALNKANKVYKAANAANKVANATRSKYWKAASKLKREEQATQSLGLMNAPTKIQLDRIKKLNEARKAAKEAAVADKQTVNYMKELYDKSFNLYQSSKPPFQSTHMIYSNPSFHAASKSVSRKKDGGRIELEGNIPEYQFGGILRAAKKLYRLLRGVKSGPKLESVKDVDKAIEEYRKVHADMFPKRNVVVEAPKPSVVSNKTVGKGFIKGGYTGGTTDYGVLPAEDIEGLRVVRNSRQKLPTNPVQNYAENQAAKDFAAENPGFEFVSIKGRPKSWGEFGYPEDVAEYLEGDIRYSPEIMERVKTPKPKIEVSKVEEVTPSPTITVGPKKRGAPKIQGSNSTKAQDKAERISRKVKTQVDYARAFDQGDLRPVRAGRSRMMEQQIEESLKRMEKDSRKVDWLEENPGNKSLQQWLEHKRKLLAQKADNAETVKKIKKQIRNAAKRYYTYAIDSKKEFFAEGGPIWRPENQKELMKFPVKYPEFSQTEANYINPGTPENYSSAVGQFVANKQNGPVIARYNEQMSKYKNQVQNAINLQRRNSFNTLFNTIGNYIK